MDSSDQPHSGSPVDGVARSGPPTWFGPLFAIFGGAFLVVAIVALGDTDFATRALFIGVSGLFVAVGIGLTIVSLRRTRPSPGPGTQSLREAVRSALGDRLPGEPDRASHAFRRPLSRVVGDLVVTPIAAIAFIGLAAALATGAIEPGGINRIIGLALSLFFAALLTLASLATASRGLGRSGIEVGARGIWTPESDWLHWHEIAEVRLETHRMNTGRRSTATIVYDRIGIIPVDPERRRGPWSARAVRRLSLGYRQILERFVPPGMFGSVEPAPFGVSSFEIEEPLAEVVLSIRAFAPVLDRSVT